jgi:hypothetical protein
MSTKLPNADLYVGTFQVVESSDGALFQKGTKITASAAQLNALTNTFTSPLIDDGDAGCTLTSADQTNAAATVTIPNIGDAADTFVMNDTAATLTGKTLTSPVLTAPVIATGGKIVDAGGDEYVVFTEASGTAATYVGITSGLTGVAPQLRGAGETNTALLLAGTGTGNVQIADGATTTKILDFELVGATAGTKTTIIASQTSNREITLPDATCTLISTTSTDTLTNKTLTTPVIASFYQDGAKTQLMTTPNTASDTLAAIAATQTLTNKTLTAPIIATIYQDAGKTKLMTLPDTASDTLVAVAATQTLTGKTLTSPVLTTPQINDTSADHQYVFAVSELAADRTVTLPLLGAGDEFVFAAHAVTLTNKTLTSPVLTTPQINDTSADHQYVFAVSELGADRTVTLPLLTGGDEFVFKDHAVTMTNKTLTTPVLTSPVITTPQINDTTADHQYVFAVSELTADRTVTLPLLTGADEFVFKDHTVTMTNKTLTAPTLTSAVITGATISSLVLDDGDENLDITVTNQTDSGATITIPDIVDSADTIVLADLAQTLTNKSIDAASNPLKNVVLSYAANITRAEMVAGKVLVAAATGRTIRVLSVKMLVTGAFNGGAGTAFILEDSSSTVDILTCLKAALTDGAKISTEGLAIANVTEGAGMLANLTAANGISVQADAAWNAGTGIDIVINYKYV